jgi:hypothetical protein
MTDPRIGADDRPSVASEDRADDLRALRGDEPEGDGDVLVDPDQIEDEAEPTFTDYEWGAAPNPDLRAGETDDPLVAIEEGLTFVPPSHPPVVPSSDPGGAEVPGSLEDDEAAESDINARIRAALESDAATSALADRLRIAVVGSTAIIRGVVDGIEDGDAIVEVVSAVAGIEDVRDETAVAGL